MPEHDIQQLRRKNYVEMPWRNGGGVTFEIARQPTIGAEFEWRLSLALIERSGPFSSFTGYQRALALVNGSGCLLHGIGEPPVALREPGDISLFSGSAAVTCELLGGTTCDFNLMVREPGAVDSARHLTLAVGTVESLRPGCENALFCLQGEVECIDSANHRSVRLGLHDTLVAPAATAASWQVRASGDRPAQLLAFAWHTASATGAHDDRRG